jgi:Bacteriocin-protection, YdeI or OmpD-Associated
MYQSNPWYNWYNGFATLAWHQSRKTQTHARARAFFETLDGTNRYAILYRVQTAKKPETRAEGITRFVALCARHETIHPPRQTKSGAHSRGTSKKARTKERQ